MEKILNDLAAAAVLASQQQRHQQQPQHQQHNFMQPRENNSINPSQRQQIQQRQVVHPSQAQNEAVFEAMTNMARFSPQFYQQFLIQQQLLHHHQQQHQQQHQQNLMQQRENNSNNTINQCQQQQTQHRPVTYPSQAQNAAMIEAMTNMARFSPQFYQQFLIQQQLIHHHQRQQQQHQQSSSSVTSNQAAAAAAMAAAASMAASSVPPLANFQPGQFQHHEPFSIQNGIMSEPSQKEAFDLALPRMGMSPQSSEGGSYDRLSIENHQHQRDRSPPIRTFGRSPELSTTRTRSPIQRRIQNQRSPGRGSPGHDAQRAGHSYIGLIGMAILSTPEKKMVLADIYQYIIDHYPHYGHRGGGWRNSIRHNLSLNECFQKAGRASNGKGHYWTIHPANMDDFMSGDFRRKRAQRKVRIYCNIQLTPEDLADEQREREGTLPALPDHFLRSLDMHRSLQDQAAVASQSLLSGLKTELISDNLCD